MKEMTRADDLAGGLAAGDTDARLKSLRAIKNSVIGSKREKTKHLLYLPIILEILSKDQEANVLVQAAQAIGSFAAASDGARQVIDQGGIPKVLLALKHPDIGVVEASARALKLLYTKTTGISQDEVQQVLQTPGASTTLIALLSSQGSPSIGESAAWIIAKCCEIDEKHAKVVFCNAGALQPLIQLLQDSTHKNRQAAALSAVTALTYNDLATCRNVLKHQNVVFDLLNCVKSSTEDPKIRFTACVCLTNLAPALSSRLTSSGGGGGSGSSILPSREEVQETVLPVLVKLMIEDTSQDTHTLHSHEKTHSKQKSSMLARSLPAAPPSTTTSTATVTKNSVAADVPGVLLQLLANNPSLQPAAVDADAILRLASLLKAPNTSLKGRISALQVLGMLTESKESESHRQKLVDCGALPAVAAALIDPSLSVRGAACPCMKSLSRSARLLRCSLASFSDIAAPLLELSNNTDSSIATEAAATLANMAMEFSAIKEHVVVSQGITRFVEMTEETDNKRLRLYGIWGLSSAVYLSSNDVKFAVMGAFPWRKVVEFLHGDDYEVKEKTFLLLRNLAHRGGDGGCPGSIEEANLPGGKKTYPATVFEWSHGQFLPQIVEALKSVVEVESSVRDMDPTPALQCSKIVEHALYSIVNIASGQAAEKDAVSNLVIADLRPIFQGKWSVLHHEQESIREAAVWVVINLTYLQDSGDAAIDGQQGLEKRRQDLIAMGMAEDLKAMRNEDSCMSVRERADTAYAQLTGSRRVLDEGDPNEIFVGDGGEDISRRLVREPLPPGGARRNMRRFPAPGPDLRNVNRNIVERHIRPFPLPQLDSDYSMEEEEARMAAEDAAEEDMSLDEEDMMDNDAWQDPYINSDGEAVNSDGEPWHYPR